MATYKPKENAYFTGVFNGNTVLIMSKHYSLEGAKEKAKYEIRHGLPKSKLCIFKFVGEVKN